MLQISRFLAALAVAGLAVAVPAVGPAAATPPVIETPHVEPCVFLLEGCDEPEWDVNDLPQTPGRAQDHEPAVRVPARRLRLAGRPRDPRRSRRRRRRRRRRRTTPDTDVQVLSATAAVAVEASPNFTG